ncbi:hypothetical protein YPPY103_0950, partial [Yersinia pestis PY-103]
MTAICLELNIIKR